MLQQIKSSIPAQLVCTQAIIMRPHVVFFSFFLSISVLIFRLGLSVRGELDLRPPWQSFIALIEDKPEHDYNWSEGGMQPEVSALLRTAAGHNFQFVAHVPGHSKVAAALYMETMQHWTPKQSCTVVCFFWKECNMGAQVDLRSVICCLLVAILHKQTLPQSSTVLHAYCVFGAASGDRQPRHGA